ncbi:MAG: methylmalonyl-CoA mutase family protein [Ilumatobacteraceae bacterium]
MSESPTLAADFETPSRDTWLRAVHGVILKSSPEASPEEFDAAFRRQLVSTTDDGIDIQPLYTASGSPTSTGLPGEAPFVRSTHADPRPWEIRQRVWASVTDSSAVGELESGATGLLVEVDGRGDIDSLARILDGVYLDLAPVCLATSFDEIGLGAAASLIELWDRRGIGAAERRGSLGVDPIGTWLRTGGAVDLVSAWDDTASLVSRAHVAAPSARVITVDGTVWHGAGANTVQELAWTIAAGAAAIRALVRDGLSLDVAARTLEFRLAATADQFTTIAKFRAARRLWARVAEVAGISIDGSAMFQHADGSRVMLTRYDTYVNTLRSTVACFSAAVGGADAVSIWPHDALLRTGGSKQGRRLARNTQSILQAESNMWRVVDPAGGSWYVESLTDQLAEAAWSELRTVEALGGVIEAVVAGHVHDSLAEQLSERRRAVATRRRPLTGLSEFPNVAEEIPSAVVEPPREHGPLFAPLSLVRLSADFEAQRRRADDHFASTGRRPQVFLATLGSPAVHTARLTFAKNLFEVAGIETVSGEVDDFASSGITMVCVCSSDAVYKEAGADAAAALRAAGATRVYLAGRRLDVPGVDEEVGMGSDVLDVLTRALDELGVA